MTITSMSITTDDTLNIAKESTVLSPRFYTTDFDALDKMDVTPVRKEWDALIAEMRSDPNRLHFKKDEHWEAPSLDDLTTALPTEFDDFLVSSMPCAFLGAIL